jgi:hypothetical protein
MFIQDKVSFKFKLNDKIQMIFWLGTGLCATSIALFGIPGIIATMVWVCIVGIIALCADFLVGY